MITTDEIAQRFTYSNFKEMTDKMEPEKDEEFWLKLIADFDDSGDGKISFDEFESNMIRMVEDSLNRRLSLTDDNKNLYINIDMISKDRDELIMSSVE